ncbi:hypothetical protein NQ317_015241 [Molorchus minor]|uniref:Uncharacterized protein n=1 Tax=Molorchus minor TaxID=1323400 RepID=A0ABQ9JQB6_9CUCU|nr:hypothetical protein NQ317_015241 [Molorchus minor]
MKAFFLLALLIFPAVIFTFDNGNKMLSYGEEDPLEDEAEVEGESDEAEIEVSGADEDEEEVTNTASPDADTTLLFVKPVPTGASQLGMYLSDTYATNEGLRSAATSAIGKASRVPKTDSPNGYEQLREPDQEKQRILRSTPDGTQASNRPMPNISRQWQAGYAQMASGNKRMKETSSHVLTECPAIAWLQLGKC